MAERALKLNVDGGSTRLAAGTGNSARLPKGVHAGFPRKKWEYFGIHCGSDLSWCIINEFTFPSLSRGARLNGITALREG